MVTTGLLEVAVHALLDDGPLAVVSDNERVQIELEPILNRGAIDLGHQTASFSERRTIETDTLSNGEELLRGLSRIFPAATADVNSKLVPQRSEATFQRSDDACRDAGLMPVHPHYSAKRLEPKGVSKPA